MDYSFNQNKILKYVLGFITFIIIFITFSPLLNFGFVMGDDIPDISIPLEIGIEEFLEMVEGISEI